MLKAEDIVTFVAGAITPCFNTHAMLEVVFPVSMVLRTVDMDINTKAISLIVTPLPLVSVSIKMHKLAKTTCLILSPLADIPRSISPLLDPESVSIAPFPLPFIERPRLISITPSLCSNVDKLICCLFVLLECEILV